jgi:glycosyltransferase 2 family protein
MHPKLTMQRVTVIAVVLFVVAGALIITLDWHDIKSVVGQANWWWILPALAVTAGSYFSLSYSNVLVFRAYKISVGYRDLMEIGFVSNVVTHLVNVGGLTGVSLEFMLLKRRGLATEDILAPSLFQLYFSSLALLAILPIGLFNVVFSHHFSQASSLGIGIAAGILTLLLVMASVIVFAKRVRTAIFRGTAWLVRKVVHRDIGKPLEDFNSTMSRGVTLMRGQPKIFAMLLVLAAADWMSTVIALWFCFYALGMALGVGNLLTGFSLGIAAGFVSLIPGGLGVQEGSMTGIYVLLGVPVQMAVLAAILFRIVYYFVPFFVSLGFYRRLLKADTQAESGFKAPG